MLLLLAIRRSPFKSRRATARRRNGVCQIVRREFVPDFGLVIDASAIDAEN
jgi:hypothetical protein